MPCPYRRIACCIDRDGMEDAVLREGLALAEEGRSEVHAVHVLRPPSALVTGPFVYVPPAGETSAEAEEWLAEVAARHPGLTATHVLAGDPAREICSWAERSEADLIVLAGRRGLLERAVVGGVASRLAYHAPCTTMILHPPAPVPDDGSALTASEA